MLYVIGGVSGFIGGEMEGGRGRDEFPTPIVETLFAFPRGREKFEVHLFATWSMSSDWSNETPAFTGREKLHDSYDILKEL